MLQSLLEGHSSKVIQGLLLTAGNFNDAMELLKVRFGDILSYYCGSHG